MAVNDATSELDIETEIDDVWRALTTDGGFEAWMGEGATIDASPGGEIHAPDPVGGRERQGLVERVERDQRIEFAWWPTDDAGDRSHVTITLEPVEVGTRVRVVERPDGAAPVPLASLAPSRWAWRASWAWRAATLSISCCSVRV